MIRSLTDPFIESRLRGIRDEARFHEGLNRSLAVAHGFRRLIKDLIVVEDPFRDNNPNDGGNLLFVLERHRKPFSIRCKQKPLRCDLRTEGSFPN